VLIPIEQDLENLNVKAEAVCSACSMHADQWLKDAGARRTGLVRPGGQVH